MIMNELIVKEAPRWARIIGRRNAIKRLVLRDFSASTAEKLCSGRYSSKLGDEKADAVLEEMQLDGFNLRKHRLKSEAS